MSPAAALRRTLPVPRATNPPDSRHVAAGRGWSKRRVDCSCHHTPRHNSSVWVVTQTDEFPIRRIRSRSLTVQIPPGQYRIAVKQIASGRRVRHNRRMAPIRLVITQNSHPPIVDPRHVFLTAAEVMARYQWGRTKGYEVMRTRRDGFPGAISGRYRLDTLLHWEDQQAGRDDEADVAELLPPLPPRKRPVRKVVS